MFKEAFGDDMHVMRDCLEAIPLKEQPPSFQIAVAKRGNEYRAILYELDDNADILWEESSEWSPNPWPTVDAIESFKEWYGY